MHIILNIQFFFFFLLLLSTSKEAKNVEDKEYRLANVVLFCSITKYFVEFVIFSNKNS